MAERLSEAFFVMKRVYSTFSAKIKALWRAGEAACRNLLAIVNPASEGCFQSPVPGSDEKCSSNLLGRPSHALASAGGSFLAVIFGHCLANSAFTLNHFSTPVSVSGLIASTGHSGSQTPQSMHSSG